MGDLSRRQAVPAAAACTARDLQEPQLKHRGPPAYGMTNVAASAAGEVLPVGRQGQATTVVARACPARMGEPTNEDAEAAGMERGNRAMRQGGRIAYHGFTEETDYLLHRTAAARNAGSCCISRESTSKTCAIKFAAMART